MKFCAHCGDLISTPDGDNRWRTCEEAAEKRRAARRKARAKANAQRREREAALRDCGLVKVRGALGGVYWE